MDTTPGWVGGREQGGRRGKVKTYRQVQVQEGEEEEIFQEELRQPGERPRCIGENGEKMADRPERAFRRQQPSHNHARTHTHTHRAGLSVSKQHRSERVPVSCLQWEQVHYGLFHMQKPAKQQVQPVHRQRCTLVTFNTRSRVVTVTGQA